MIETVALPSRKPRTALKRVNMKRGTTKLKKKRTRAKKLGRNQKWELIRETYGLPLLSTFTFRYKQPIERGVLWYWFSLYIRSRDRDKPCISCNNPKQDMHGGHFVPAGSASWDDMVFSEKNVNAECAWCNKNDKVKLRYEYNLDLKYGTGTAQSLKDEYYGAKFRGTAHKNWSRAVLIRKIEEYRIKYASLNP